MDTASSRTLTVIGVMSDTHGNRELMHAVADRMVAEFGAEIIYHLGDTYADAQELAFAGLPVQMVPGLWCPEYHNGRIPRRLADSLQGVTVACAHADQDVSRTMGTSALVFTGHTHVARIAQVGKTLHINPGHLTAAIHRGERASFAIVEIDAERIRAAIHEAAGEVRSRVDVDRGELI